MSAPDAPDELERLVIEHERQSWERHGSSPASRDRLLSHVRAIERERPTLHEMLLGNPPKYVTWAEFAHFRDEADTLRASNARLREALVSGAQICRDAIRTGRLDPDQYRDCVDQVYALERAAEAALASTASPVGDKSGLSPTEDV